MINSLQEESKIIESDCCGGRNDDILHFVSLRRIVPLDSFTLLRCHRYGNTHATYNSSSHVALWLRRGVAGTEIPGKSSHRFLIVQSFDALAAIGAKPALHFRVNTDMADVADLKVSRNNMWVRRETIVDHCSWCCQKITRNGNKVPRYSFRHF